MTTNIAARAGRQAGLRPRLAALLSLLASITAATPPTVAFVQRLHVERELATLEVEIGVLRDVLARQRSAA